MKPMVFPINTLSVMQEFSKLLSPLLISKFYPSITKSSEFPFYIVPFSF